MSSGKNWIELSLITNSIKRLTLSRFSDYKRVFILKENSFEIVDYVMGNKEFTSSCTLHFDVEVNINTFKKNCFSKDNRAETVLFSNDKLCSEQA